MPYRKTKNPGLMSDSKFVPTWTGSSEESDAKILIQPASNSKGGVGNRENLCTSWGTNAVKSLTVSYVEISDARTDSTNLIIVVADLTDWGLTAPIKSKYRHNI